MLESKKFTRSCCYLERMYKVKQKWAETFLPTGFTGGVHTTSRSESMNALVKKYCNSNSEISDVIEFLEAFEKKFIFEEIKYSKQTNSQYENHPVILEMKKTYPV